jgi:hypothetical protein
VLRGFIVVLCTSLVGSLLYRDHIGRESTFAGLGGGGRRRRCGCNWSWSCLLLFLDIYIS